jgi:hypothetical protein
MIDKLSIEGGSALLLVMTASILMIKSIFDDYKKHDYTIKRGWGNESSNYIILSSQVFFVVFLVKDRIGYIDYLFPFLIILNYLYGNHKLFWKNSNSIFLFYYFSVSNGFIFIISDSNLYYFILIILVVHLRNSIAFRY